ncbi:MAG: Gfo/Idh/MocA family oxidoreductase [Actinomycetota bacterium]|nr:Gfo/Idh/MocA family oxidoreductase [Actinomycetota bacterium]
MRTLTLVTSTAPEAARELTDYLNRAGWTVLSQAAGADVVLVLDPAGLGEGDEDALLGRGVPVVFVGPTMSTAVSDAAGLVPGPLSPEHEVRLRPGPAAGAVTHRMPDPLVVFDRWPLQDKVADDVEVLLTANLAYADHPVATYRPSRRIATLTVGSSTSTLRDPAWHRLVHVLLRRACEIADPPGVRVGLLGYGAIGHEHSHAISRTEGLQLTAVADGNPQRRAAATVADPTVRLHATGDELLADDTVDLVVVSTPPDSHARWVLRALDAGKSVVVEKPFCLTVEEADRQIDAAAARGLLLTVYQNRRWDADYLALRRLVRADSLGEVFHYESFVGGYGHPCNFWHSDEAVSGGAIYDWGSHYLDWVLDLFPQEVAWVSATTHKRVWHDVTNADHSRVLVHFADGAEAEFTHSDLAAARKPKFYLLGTRGALVGDWRQERVVSRSAVGTLVEDTLAVSDAPAALRTFTPDGSGGVSETMLSLPPAPKDPFHRELADHLLTGAPLSVTARGSRRNIAVMEAATRSARAEGRPVRPADPVS